MRSFASAAKLDLVSEREQISSTMCSVRACALPEQSLLAKYARPGAYTDCYSAEIARTVSAAEYVEVFYTGSLFKLERLLLARIAFRPSTDEHAKELALGIRDTFAAWRVEERSAEQLLMRDFSGRTRSWLMVIPAGSGGSRLYFGSAVVPMGFRFKALLGFHKLYSRALLDAARSRLARLSVRTS
jgi:hypothetical protein